MADLLIKGFRSEAEAKAFAQWYEGQGEQDAIAWFECREQEGEIDRDFIGVKSIKTDDGLVVMEVKP